MKMITGEGALLKNGELIAIVQYQITYKEECDTLDIEKGVLYFPTEAMTANVLNLSIQGQFELEVEHYGAVQITLQEKPTLRKRTVKITNSM